MKTITITDILVLIGGTIAFLGSVFVIVTAFTGIEIWLDERSVEWCEFGCNDRVYGIVQQEYGSEFHRVCKECCDKYSNDSAEVLEELDYVR